MKKYAIILVIWFFLSALTLPSNNVDLKGTWTGNCISNRPNKASIEYCALCSQKQIDKSSVEINGFEMKVQESVLELNINGNRFAAAYKFEKDTLTFTYKDFNFVFSVQSTTDEDIKFLKAENGLGVILTRVTKQN